MLSFLTMTPKQQADATAWLAAMPRSVRKAYRPERKASASRNVISHDAVDSYMKTEYRTDTYHIQNLEFLDRAYDYDEFSDIDNEYADLTIVEPENETDLWAFCTGYDNI
jgi:hypothetical protein